MGPCASSFHNAFRLAFGVCAFGLSHLTQASPTYTHRYYCVFRLESKELTSSPKELFATVGLIREVPSWPTKTEQIIANIEYVRMKPVGDHFFGSAIIATTRTDKTLASDQGLVAQFDLKGFDGSREETPFFRIAENKKFSVSSPSQAPTRDELDAAFSSLQDAPGTSCISWELKSE
ncbi:MAG: hypothetical protein JST16_00550 [Bdellovibrionales bacterium]|nr:hypothetical protein [Bdellovibrionales bacterium]